MALRRAALLIALTLVGSDAVADEVHLRNGDRYTGKVVRLAGGTLTFKTPHGELGISWSEVTRLTLDEPMLARDPDGGEAQRAGTIDIATTAELSPPEAAWQLTGGAAAGFVATAGNSAVNSLRLDADGVLRVRANRYTANASGNRSEDRGVETARNWTTSLRYDRFVTPRLFVNANTILTSDAFRDLDLRTALGAGVGYQFADTARLKLNADGGVGYVRENFSSAPNNQYTALRESGKLDVLIVGDRLVLFHRHDGYFGVTGDDNLFVKTQNGVRFALLARFVATAQLDFDYDRSPAPGRRHADRTFALTFGYRF